VLEIYRGLSYVFYKISELLRDDGFFRKIRYLGRFLTIDDLANIDFGGRKSAKIRAFFLTEICSRKRTLRKKQRYPDTGASVNPRNLGPAHLGRN